MALLFSCRNDLLVENDAKSKAEIAALTSKIISLNESAHKKRILPELQFAKQTLSKKSINAFGKMVNFGDSISIDTENVIYIENGSNYHTYTFNILRSNPQPNDPVENLLLSPLPDGTYKEFLVIYNLSPQEKHRLRNGQAVDTKGKTIIKELISGTFNGNHQLAKTTMVCSWGTSTYWQACCHDVHNQSNFQDTNPDSFGNWMNCSCTSSGRATVYTVTSYNCVEDLTTSWDDGTGNTGGGGGSGGPVYCPECLPCPVSTIMDSPQDSSTSLGTDCNPIIPTLPNLEGGSPNANNPCAKTKEFLINPLAKPAIAALKTQSTMGGEKGVKFEADGTPSAIISGEAHSVNLGNKTGYQGGYHNHTPTGIKMQSPPDIDQLLGFARAQGNYGNPSNAFLGMVAPNGMHYVIRFNGSYADALVSYSQVQLDNQTLLFAMRYGLLNSSLSENEKLEILFFKTLNDMGLNGKVVLQRIENDGTVGAVNVIKTITLNTDGTIKAVSCP